MDFVLKRCLQVVFDWTLAFSYMLWPIKWEKPCHEGVPLKKIFNILGWTCAIFFFFEISSYTKKGPPRSLEILMSLLCVCDEFFLWFWHSAVGIYLLENDGLYIYYSWKRLVYTFKIHNLIINSAYNVL